MFSAFWFRYCLLPLFYLFCIGLFCFCITSAAWSLFCFKQSDIDSKASPYLKRELLRIYTKERMWRERLWRKGIIKSTPMCPRKCPESVGTEEVILYFLLIFGFGLIQNSYIGCNEYLLMDFVGSNMYDMPAVFISECCCLLLSASCFCMPGGKQILVSELVQ